MWRDLERDVAARQAELLARLREKEDAGEPLTVSDLYREERYRAYLAQIEAARDALARDGADILSEEKERVVLTAETFTERMAAAAYREATGEAIALPWNTLSARAVEAIAGATGDGTPLTDALKRIHGDRHEAARSALVSGIGRGASADEIAKDLEKAGRQSRERARVWAANETNRAHREAARQLYLANADRVDGYVWHSRRDARTCVVCWAMHGTRHESQAPFGTHTSCRCTMLPLLKGVENDPAAKVRTGEAEFAELPESRQREILGPARFALYQEGTPLSEMVRLEEDPLWGPSRSLVPVTELEG